MSCFYENCKYLVGVHVNFISLYHTLQDVEMYELNVLRGATKMLQDCHPVLFVEMQCYHLNKSVIALLRRLGYAMAWVIAPFVSHTELLEEFIKNKGLGYVTYRFAYGGRNIVAVPKERANELVAPLVPILDSDFTADGLYKGKVISVCHGTHGCIEIKESINGTMCGNIPEESANYWMNIPEFVGN